MDGTLWNSVVAIPQIDFAELEEDCQEGLQEETFPGRLEKLIDKNVRKEFEGRGFKGYFSEIIEPEWQDGPADITAVKRETLAAMDLLRQNPSFARIRRVWRTAQTFWQEILAPDGGGAR